MQPIEEVPGAPSISTDSTSVKGEAPAWWASHDEALADWCLARHVARKDVHGAYRPDGGQYTAHSPLTRELLIRHFRGEITIGCHSTSTDGRCLSVVADIDAHDGKGADPDVNWRCALAVAEMFGGLDLTALICDSDGKGGYHVRVFFKKSVPVAVAYWLGSRINAGLAAEGLPAVEFFPKQAELTLDCPYGNWLRLPGRHHKRDHWTRIFDHVSGRWLEGEGAVLGLIGIAGDKTTKLLATYKAEQAAKAGAVPVPKKAGASRRHDREEEPGEARVREALDYLPASMADSYGGSRSDTGWLGIGMALHDWDEVRGLALWHAFSARSPKYDPAVLDDKWTTFTRGGGLTVATIFKAARDGGWKPSDATAKAPVNGRAEAGPSGDGDLSGPGEPVADFKALREADMGMVVLEGAECRPMRWMWKHRLSLGGLSLMAGDAGIGKSQVLLWIAAQVSIGGPWADGSGHAPLGDVIICSAEDRIDDTIKPRMIALGADLARVTVVKAKYTLKRPGKPDLVQFASLQDRGYWADVFRRRPECKLFIVDPLPSYLGHGVNDAKNIEIRNIVEPFLDEIIAPLDICMIANTHLNKAADLKTPLHRISGSTAYGALPRNVQFVLRDPGDPATRYLKQAKCNNAPDDLCALAFRIEQKEVCNGAGEVIETAIPVFEAAGVEIDLQATMNGGGGKAARRGPEPTQRRGAAEWLHDYLAGQPGPTLMAAVFDAAGEAGHAGHKKADGRWSNIGTLYRAFEMIPNLAPPRGGCRVVEAEFASGKSGRRLKHWGLERDEGSPDVEPTGTGGTPDFGAAPPF